VTDVSRNSRVKTMNEHEAWIEGTKMCRELDIDHIIMRTLKSFAESYKIASDERQRLRTDFTCAEFINELRIPTTLKECYIVEYNQLKE